MPVASRRVRTGAVLLAVATSIVIAGCSTEKPTARKTTRSKEYFAESAYGVKASPRVSNLKTKLPRGGGRDQVGKPYKVKGRWYYPKEEPKLTQRGQASWYGDAFHGRLTANGEIYDMTHLTAAHPTMPLPSYARVTNLKNGTSVIVRVNDRGPFERGRVIDLSRKAAEMLDYQHYGMADVKVDYVGRAPLHGKDDQFLMASYRPAGKPAFDPNDGLATGVMIAMNGPTPTRASTVAYPSQVLAFGVAGTGQQLPELGPIAPERPAYAFIEGELRDALAYAPTGYNSDKAAGLLAIDRAVSANPEAGSDYIAVGTFETEREAKVIADRLNGYGHATIEADAGSYSVALKTDGSADIDTLLEMAWAAGAGDAFIVRE